MTVGNIKYTISSISKIINGTIYELRGPRNGFHTLLVYHNGKADMLTSNKWSRRVVWSF